jgi:hypothetical protein
VQAASTGVRHQTRLRCQTPNQPPVSDTEPASGVRHRRLDTAVYAVWHLAPFGIWRRLAFRAVWHSAPFGILRRLAFCAPKRPCAVPLFTQPSRIRLCQKVGFARSTQMLEVSWKNGS